MKSTRKIIGTFLAITAFMFVFAQSYSQNECVDIKNDLEYRNLDIDKNNEVTKLQTYLVRAGFLNAEPTGYFGPLTFASVQAFQTANNISSTGYFGPLSKARVKFLTCGSDSVSTQSTINTRTPPSVSATSIIRTQPISYTSISQTLGAPVVTITKAQDAVLEGGKTIITWSSKDADSCVTPFSSTQTGGVFITPSLYSTTSYSVTCSNSKGSASISLQVGVEISNISSAVVYYQAVTIPFTTSTVPIAPSPTISNTNTFKFEAEKATIIAPGRIQTASAANSGQVVGNLNDIGTGINYVINSNGIDDKATLSVRYSNGFSGNSTLDLYVNGVKQILTFPSTSNWMTFSSTSNYNIKLVNGVNTIKIEKGSANTNTADIDSMTIVTTRDLTYSAVSTPSPASYTLTVNTPSNGTVSGTNLNCGLTCTRSVTSGTQVTLTATPNSGYTFSGWNGACSGTSNTCTVTVNSNMSVGAGFTKAPVSVSIQAESGIAYGGAHIQNDSAAQGSKVVGGLHSVGSGLSMSYNSSLAVNAKITMRYSMAHPENGSIALYINNVRIKALDLPRTSTWSTYADLVINNIQLKEGGNEISFRNNSPYNYAPNIDYIVIGDINSQTQTPGQQNPTPSPASYTLTVNTPSNGTVSGTNLNCGLTCTRSVTSGTQVTLTATPNSGYTFSGWNGSCSGTSNTCTVTVNSNMSVGAGFTVIPVTQVPGNPSGPITVASGKAVYVSVGGSDLNSGTFSSPFQTLSKGMSMMTSGDTLAILPGTYRETLTVPSGLSSEKVTYIKAVTPGTVFIKGSEEVSGWTKDSENVYYTTRSTEPAYVFRNGMSLKKVAGTVFNGYPERQTATLSSGDLAIGNIWEGRVSGGLNTLRSGAHGNSFYYDSGAKRVYVWVSSPINATEKLEISSRKSVLDLRANNTVVEGINFTHSDTVITARDAGLRLEGSNIVLKNNDVSYMSSQCVYIIGNNITVEGNKITYCGQTGIAGIGRNHKILNNTVMYNNTFGFNQNWEAGGMKFIGPTNNGIYDTVVRGNTVAYNTGAGIWFDWLNSNITIEDNTVAYNSNHGIFYEASLTGNIRRNIVYGNAWRGIHGSGSANTTISDNKVFGNSYEGITIVTDDRSANNPQINAKNNTFTNNKIMWNDHNRNYIQLIVPGVSGFNTIANGNSYNAYPVKPRMSVGYMGKGTWYSDITAFRNATGFEVNGQAGFEDMPSTLKNRITSKALLSLEELPQSLK